MTPEQNTSPPADSLAARMYPNEAQASAAAPASAPKQPRPDDLAARMYAANGDALPASPTVPSAVTVDELIAREQDAAESLYAAGGPVPESPEGYNGELGGAFDRLEFQARYDQDEADIAALAEGREQSAALLHELAVPAQEAGEITRTLGEWHGREALPEGELLDAKGRAIDQLEREWGPEAAARIELAQRTARDACKRMPWLSDLLARGAGNDPGLIRTFASIGLRNARRSRR